MLHLQYIKVMSAAAALLTVLAVGCSSDDTGTGAAAGVEVIEDEFKLAQQFALSIPMSSTKFNETIRIPRLYSCTQKDISPPITWGEVPEGTVSLALVVDSNQHPGPPWVHWVLWGIPADARGLPEAVPNTAEAPSVGPKAGQGTNNDKKVGWLGPCPPRVHLYSQSQASALKTYTFKLFAVDIDIALGAGATKDDLLQAMDGHILAGGELIGGHMGRVEWRR